MKKQTLKALRKKYRIREGDIIRMSIESRPDKTLEAIVTKKKESESRVYIRISSQ